MGGRRWKGEERSDQPAGRGGGQKRKYSQGSRAGKDTTTRNSEGEGGERVAWREVKQKKESKGKGGWKGKQTRKKSTKNELV